MRYILPNAAPAVEMACMCREWFSWYKSWHGLPTQPILQNWSQKVRKLLHVHHPDLTFFSTRKDSLRIFRLPGQFGIQLLSCATSSEKPRW